MPRKKNSEEERPEEEISSEDPAEIPETKSTHEEDSPVEEHNEVPDPSPEFGAAEPEETQLQDPADEIIPSRELLADSEEVPPPPSAGMHQPPAPISPHEERNWAMWAHLSVLLNLVTGFLGGVAAIIIYFIYKDRSRYIAYHAMQSFIFQCITWLGAGILAAICIAIASTFFWLIIPLLCLVPGLLFILLPPASLIYGIVGGVKVNNGEDFRYWLVGDWVRNILEPQPKTDI